MYFRYEGNVPETVGEDERCQLLLLPVDHPFAVRVADPARTP